MSEALDRIVAREHSDPHSVLGAHQANGSVVVRAFRPDAERVVLLVEGADRPVELQRAHPGGVFEGTVRGELPLRY